MGQKTSKGGEEEIGGREHYKLRTTLKEIIL